MSHTKPIPLVYPLLKSSLMCIAPHDFMWACVCMLLCSFPHKTIILFIVFCNPGFKKIIDLFHFFLPHQIYQLKLHKSFLLYIFLKIVSVFTAIYPGHTWWKLILIKHSTLWPKFSLLPLFPRLYFLLSLCITPQHNRQVQMHGLTNFV